MRSCMALMTTLSPLVASCPVVSPLVAGFVLPVPLQALNTVMLIASKSIIFMRVYRRAYTPFIVCLDDLYTACKSAILPKILARVSMSSFGRADVE